MVNYNVVTKRRVERVVKRRVSKSRRRFGATAACWRSSHRSPIKRRSCSRLIMAGDRFTRFIQRDVDVASIHVRTIHHHKLPVRRKTGHCSLLPAFRE